MVISYRPRMIALYHAPQSRSSRLVCKGSPLIPRHPLTLIDAYSERVTSRPAYARAQAKDAPA